MSRESYKGEILSDLRNYASELINAAEYYNADTNEFDRKAFGEILTDAAWTCDAITGNASGSYTCNTWEAEEKIAHSWDILIEAATAYGIEPIISDGWEYGAEYWDVTIRCYLLGECAAIYADEIGDEYETK